MLRRLTLVPLAGLTLVAMIASPAVAVDPLPLATTTSSVDLTAGRPNLTAAAGPMAFIAAESPRGRGPGRLFVVDSGTAAITKSISIGPLPMGLAVTPDGSRVITSSWQERAVRVINPRTGALIRKIPVGGQADAVTIGPKGASAFVYVIDKGTIVKVDLSSNRIKGRYPIKTCKNEQPVSLAVTPDSSTLLVSCDESGVIFMSTSSGRVIGTVNAAGGGVPTFSPDGTVAYVGSSIYFSAVNIKSRSVVGSSTLWRKGDGDVDGIESPMSIAVDGDASAVYAVMPEVGQISVLDPLTGKQLSRVAMDGTPVRGVTSVIFGPNGRLSGVGQKLLTIDPQSNSVIGVDALSPPGPGATPLVFQSVLLDGSRIGIPWAVFDGGEQSGSGFTMLTMP